MCPHRVLTTDALSLFPFASVVSLTYLRHRILIFTMKSSSYTFAFAFAFVVFALLASSSRAPVHTWARREERGERVLNVRREQFTVKCMLNGGKERWRRREYLVVCVMGHTLRVKCSSSDLWVCSVESERGKRVAVNRIWNRKISWKGNGINLTDGRKRPKRETSIQHKHLFLPRNVFIFLSPAICVLFGLALESLCSPSAVSFFLRIFSIHSHKQVSNAAARSKGLHTIGFAIGQHTKSQGQEKEEGGRKKTYTNTVHAVQWQWD